MEKKRITIRMPKNLLADWLAALRSGKYPQGRGRLRSQPNPGVYTYCCLGVLQHVKDGEVELSRFHNQSHGISEILPSGQWLEANGVSFSGMVHRNGVCTTPYLPTLDTTADNANDAGVTFSRIADAIEACAEGY